jgi:hypothetical protein
MLKCSNDETEKGHKLPFRALSIRHSNLTRISNFVIRPFPIRAIFVDKPLYSDSPRYASITFLFA